MSLFIRLKCSNLKSTILIMVRSEPEIKVKKKPNQNELIGLFTSQAILKNALNFIFNSIK